MSRHDNLKPHNDLADLCQSQVGTNLNVRLDIGHDKHLHIDHFCFELSDNPFSAAAMPGVGGPLSHLSSGSKHLNVLEDGGFIDMNGMQRIGLDDTSWELCWTDGIPSGNFMCGMTVAQDYTRNGGSVFPGGRCYMTFPVFTKDGLEELRQDKIRLLKQAKDLQERKHAALERVASTLNPLMKAKFYREAFDAEEMYESIDVEKLNMIPSMEDCVPCGEFLFLSKKGRVWKDNTVNGRDGILGLGSAYLSTSGDAERSGGSNSPLLP